MSEITRSQFGSGIRGKTTTPSTPSVLPKQPRLHSVAGKKFGGVPPTDPNAPADRDYASPHRLARRATPGTFWCMNDPGTDPGGSHKSTTIGRKAALGGIGALVIAGALFGKAAVKGGKALFKVSDEAVAAARHAPAERSTVGLGAATRAGVRAARPREKEEQQSPFHRPPTP